MKIDFWQLSSDTAEKVVALIAQRVLDQGERLLVVSADPAARRAISQALWKAEPTSFLAHGEAGEDGAERQPILLGDACEAANGASQVIFADGRFRDPAGFVRAFLLFDEASLEHARQTWKALGGREGLERAFYRQDGGRWIREA